MPVYNVTVNGQKLRITADDLQDLQIAVNSIPSANAPQTPEYAPPTEGMSGMEQFVAGIAAGAQRPAMAAAQLTPAISQQDIAERERLNAPLMETLPGKAGAFVGEVGAMLPFMAAGGGSIPMMAGIGAGTGALFTPGGIPERATGAAIGGALGPVGEGAARLVRGVGEFGKSAIEPLLPKGPERIAARTIQRMATDPNAVMRAPQYQPPIPGYQPTLAEATLDPGIAQLQRGLPEPGQLALSEQANVQALTRGIENIAGTPEALAEAQAIRSKISTPLYTAARKSASLVDTTRTVNLIDRLSKANPSTVGPQLKSIRESLFVEYLPQERARDAYKVLNEVLAGRNANAPGSTEMKTVRTIVGRVRDGKITPESALSQLRGLSPKKADFSDALSLTKDILKTPDYVIQQGPQQLMDAAGMVQELASKKENKFIRKQLRTVQKSLENQIKKAVPEFGQAETAFRQASVPINQMQIGQELYGSLVPPLAQGTEFAGITPANFAKAAANLDELARQATGGPRGMRAANIMTPQQMQTIESTRQALARRVQAQELGKARGSPTAQNLATENILRRTLGPIGFPQTMTEQTILPSLAGPAAMFGKGLQALGVEKRVQEELARQMMNPAAAAAAAQRIPALGQQQRGLLDYITPALPSIGLGVYNP